VHGIRRIGLLPRYGGGRRDKRMEGGQRGVVVVVDVFCVGDALVVSLLFVLDEGGDIL